MKKANSTLFPVLGSWLVALAFVLAVNTGASAQCVLTCNDLVQVSLDGTCESEILPDMVLEGGGCPNGVLRVQAKINGVWVPASGNFIATSANINQTLQVKVRDLVTGNFCIGNIHVEDKLAPSLVCQDITLSCAITTYSPIYLLDELGISEAYPDVNENCGSFTLTYIDTWHDLTCTGTINGQTDMSAYVKRIWTAVDQSGNQSSCTQYIYFARRHVTQVLFPADITVDCSNPVTTPAATGAPYVLDFGQQFPIFPGTTFCELNANYTDQILPVCDGTYKILRTWVVYDWCLPTTPNPPSTNPLYFIQLIKVTDSEGPAVECPEDITVNTNPWDCESDTDLPDVIISDNCSQIASIQALWTGSDGAGHSLYGTLTNFPGNNLWNPDTLGVLGIAPNLPIGVTQMTYIVTDDCGNTTVCAFNITVADDTPPTAACDKFTQVSLGVDGTVLINASTFDDGSYDNCSPVHFKVRRMDTSTCQLNDRFFDQVRFCCEDLGDTVTVIFRVYDVPVPAGEVDLDFEEWHSNDCMVQVFVDDKLKPTCVAPANVTVSCESFDPSLWAYGTATAEDNCCIDTITESRNYNLFDTLCNKGTITRTFRTYDCAGQQNQCTQRIIVNYEQDYFVKFPNDVIVTACDGTGNFGEPSFFGKDCELLGVTFEDDVFTVVPDACYKIERTWKIINWCTYNPNAGCITVPNPNPNATSNSPQNLPGPIVSACGTAAPWNPTIVSIAPGQPQTNFCTFYDANANCYIYKQIIKIIDTQKPTAICPASPAEYCDLTVNDPLLWNQSYWWDPIVGQHDLCEGDAPLTITATDACSGANVNISYLLFLDLDGDNTMETVVSSNNTPAPGTVNFNNAGNPSYTGGTPQIFDGRPVLPNEIYRWANHQSVSGTTRTASVQWKTFAQMPTPTNQFGSAGIAPQLPYGTHKIKWTITDGCGNETYCEYTFVVKDCKAPTVVCHNGLSVNIMPTQMVQMWASDFLQYAEDNCTPPTPYTAGPNQLKFAIRIAGTGTDFPVDALGNPITSVTFTCADLGKKDVELWAMDLAGNADYCLTFVDVQDNNNNCVPGAPAIAGFLKTEMLEGVEDAEVNLSGIGPNGQAIALNDMTDNLGTYLFPSGMVPVGSNFTLAPTKDDNPLNGVSTFDLVQINKHILGITPLNSPYKMIAADANHSNSITTFDVVEIRKLILGIYANFPNNTSWRFVNKDFLFPEPSNPFTTPFQEMVVITNMQIGLSDEFVSVKVGDVNNTAIANSFTSIDDRSAGTLYFDLNDREVKAGEEFVAHFKAADLTAGYQFTLNTNGLQVLEIIPGDHMTTDNFAVFNDAVTASVDGNAGEFSVRFRALNAGTFSRMIGFSNRITRAESYTESGDRNEVALRFSGAAGQIVTAAGFELLQNTPNPVKSATNISFHLPEATNATLTVSNAEGRILKVLKGSFAKGINTVTLNRADLQAGILFYQLDTPTHSAVKKMIVVE
ncbi:MAG: T9SS type A sorting domain-containing protein [Lewinellaceae bacterium]|nr:T9SS type A sorting domain-containing protein [Lewinellaceae bacterium]